MQSGNERAAIREMSRADRSAEEVRRAITAALERTSVPDAEEQLAWFAFPQTFPNAVIPSSELRDEEITAQVIAVVLEDGVYFSCARRFVYRKDAAEGMEIIRAQRLPIRSRPPRFG